jgi:hypothetical protein
MYFWGAYANDNYGWDRTGKDISQVNNTYIRWHFSGTLELLALMLDYYDHTRDQAFLKDELLPLADEILLFWDRHYERDDAGKLLMHPAQALETYQNVSNPTPDIAGLIWVLDGLLKQPEQSLGTERVERWQKLKSEVPQLPIALEGNKPHILPAGKVLQPVANCENPELYAVYPFRIFGVGKPDVETGRETFAKRANRDNSGWQQNDTQAAFLGLADEARDYVTQRLEQEHPSSRFPAFWGPNYDWIPDQDHGTNALMALQTMLLQADNGKIILLPSWPKEWEVEFKLHAPQKTTVEGVYRSGKLQSLRVTPKSRMKDVVVMEPQ